MNEADIERAIADLARECGVVLNDGRVGFTSEGDDKLPDDDVAQERDYARAVWPWRRLMLESINYLCVLGVTFRQLLQKGQDNDHVKATLSLSTRAMMDARSVLHLTDHGYVIQAGIIARTCIETIEALALFMWSPEDVDAFVAAEDPDQANHAWYSVIRGKARKAINEVFSEAGIDRDEDTEKWIGEVRRIFGGYTHPTYMSAFLDLYLEWDEGREGNLMLPARTLQSVKIYQAVAAACFECASVILLVVSGPKRADDDHDGAVRSESDYQNVGFFDDAWLDSYASRGHKFFQKLWIFFLTHQEQEPFSLWKKAA